MKLIRLTDTRYVLDAGPDVTQERMYEIQQYWVDWWRRDTEVPTVVIVGGVAHPLEYEDRRESDIEARLQFLEQHVHWNGQFETSGPRWADIEEGEQNGEDSDEESKDD